MSKTEIKEYGTITRIDGDIAVVEFKRNQGCSSCGLCMCGQDDSTMLLKAHACPNSKPGDRVQIEVDRHTRAHAQLWLLAVPMAAFLLTALLAKSIFKLNDLLSFSLSIAGLALAFLLAWLMDKKTGWSTRPVARIADPKESTDNEASNQ
jgi:positive regulator of sigma E activity